MFASCRDKVICPAFQSTYILDDSVRNTYFSYAWYLNEDERKLKVTVRPKVLPPDSLGLMMASADESTGVDYFAYTQKYKVLPRVPSRTKYGIVKRTPVIPNLVRNLQLKTSPMENVLTPPEVTKEKETTLDPIPSDSSMLAPLDSTAIVATQDSLSTRQPVDSLAVIELSVEEIKKKAWEQFKYGFNLLDIMQPDQAYYFRRYGWLLQNAAPPKEEPVDSNQFQTITLDSLNSDSTFQNKGFKGLFKKKDKPKKEKRKKRVDDESTSETPGENTDAIKPEEGEGDTNTNESGN